MRSNTITLTIALLLSLTPAISAGETISTVRSLDIAVQDLNEKTADDRAELGQPEVKVDEVVAAIRAEAVSNPERYQWFEGIAETKRLPPGAKLEGSKTRASANGFETLLWQVNLVLSRGELKGTLLTVRRQFISAMKKKSSSLENASGELANADVDSPDASTKAKKVAVPTAFDGFCVVSLVEPGVLTKGESKFKLVHEGLQYFFLSEEELAKFRNDPKRFALAHAGKDMITLIGDQKPLMGNRKYMSRHDERTYVFATEANWQRFRSGPQQYVDRVRRDTEIIEELRSRIGNHEKKRGKTLEQLGLES